MSKQPAKPANEISEKERLRREELARIQQEHARNADTREDTSDDANVSTFILPGD
ncbi:MAG: hypothetical protein Hals2KO_28950 [Halioglobus sp.]